METQIELKDIDLYDRSELKNYDAYIHHRNILRPDIDHSILSPNGYISNRTRRAYNERLSEEQQLFDIETEKNMPEIARKEIEAYKNKINRHEEITGLISKLNLWTGFLKQNYQPRIAKREIEKIEKRLKELGV